MENNNNNNAMIREWFDRVDSHKTGTITAPQLKSALAVGNLECPLSVVEQMIKMYDFDRNGTMSFEEFVALNKFLIKVQHAFSDLERGRGFLVLDDVFEALVKIGFTLDSPAFYSACALPIVEYDSTLRTDFEDDSCMLHFVKFLKCISIAKLTLSCTR
ncbi:uncharacterized protein [Arachis hypogaea]|uniref:uncharacterized protein isoform X3 n=1 Tax=Arachis hypogaea TaxID=3818 RepID=UPI000DEC15AF|nr:sorcin isoform X3 [Arachis hypogaea]